MTDLTASSGERLGSAGLALVGDLNGDRLPEMAAGVPLDDAGGLSDSGSVVILGLQSDCDGDGWTPFAADCDDADGSRHPGQPDVCDGVDNDCDGKVDEGCPSGTR
jgi:hypothetical protein